MIYAEDLDPDQLQKVKDVFHEYGFLTENYRKSECLERASDVILSFFLMRMVVIMSEDN